LITDEHIDGPNIAFPNYREDRIDSGQGVGVEFAIIELGVLMLLL
jgi:hypothetical protein